MVEHRRQHGARRRTRQLSRRVLALIGIPALSLAMLSTTGYAAASGTGGSLTFTPPTGPVGTRVAVNLFAEPPSQTTYLLSASPTNPAQDNCADGVQLSDAPKIIVMPGQPTTATFTWPGDGEFSSGAYYLCASPAGGQAGPTIWSPAPFLVTGGNSSSGTTALPSGSGVIAQAPDGGVLAGGDVTLTVASKAALGGDTPQDFGLTQPGQSGAVPIQSVLTGQNGAVYIYDVTVPQGTQPGTYAVRVSAADGSISATSNTFQVVEASAPLPISVPGTTATSLFSPLLVAIIALLLALAVVSLTAPLLRRWRHAGRPPDAPTR